MYRRLDEVVRVGSVQGRLGDEVRVDVEGFRPVGGGAFLSVLKVPDDPSPLAAQLLRMSLDRELRAEFT